MIHLKPVGVSADGCPAAAAMTCISEPLTSDDAYVPAHPAAQQPVGQQRADLVAGELPAAADDGAPVGVRVLGDRDVGTDPRRPAPSAGRSRRAPPGSGRRRSGTPGRGASCSGTLTGSASPAAANTARVVSAPTPCIAV